MLTLLANEFRGQTVRITRGIGAGQERIIASNTTTAVTVTSAWSITPDSSSKFAVVETAWRFGATGQTSPIEFDVPNRTGATIHISGRAANANDKECFAELSQITRWRLGSGAGLDADNDLPPLPAFSVSTDGQGSISVLGIGFDTLVNTRTVSAGTVTLHYWNELRSPSAVKVSAAIDASATTLTLTSAGGGIAGSLIQVEGEVMVVTAVTGGGTQYTVERGKYGSGAEAHAANAPVYELESATSVMAFGRDFFGSPASGSFIYSIDLPQTRVAAGELYMTNVWGNSGAKKVAFTGNTDFGVRTLSGGQITLQVEGYLSIENDASQPFVMDSSRCVRDVFAVVEEAPTGSPIQLRLRRNTTEYCTLTIATGATISNVVAGFGLPPLTEGSSLSLDIVSVGSDADTTPGRDLTVRIRI